MLQKISLMSCSGAEKEKVDALAHSLRELAYEVEVRRFGTAFRTS